MVTVRVSVRTSADPDIRILPMQDLRKFGYSKICGMWIFRIRDFIVEI